MPPIEKAGLEKLGELRWQNSTNNLEMVYNSIHGPEVLLVLFHK